MENNQNKKIEGLDSPAIASNNRIPPKDLIKILFWIVLVVAIGMLAVNQTLGFFYKAYFLKQPCDLCAELNPEVEECILNLNAPRASFPDGMGGWTDPYEKEIINVTISNK
jgi:hypothetical protein